jgi:predicted  nucleic acid-binding Zn-ribbon protein
VRNAATMTEEERLFLVDIKSNTQKLFQQISGLEIEKGQLKKQVIDLTNEIETKKQENSELSQKIEQLKLATHLLSGVDENKEARMKLNKLIREIDKCIALLNK